MKKYNQLMKKSLALSLSVLLGLSSVQVAFANDDTELPKLEEQTEINETNQEDTEQILTQEEENDETVSENIEENEGETEDATDSETENVIEDTETKEPVEKPKKEARAMVAPSVYGITTVNDITELTSALSAALDGDIIKLATGFVVGDVTLQAPNADVTLDASNVEWTLSKIKIEGASAKKFTIVNLNMNGVGNNNVLLNINRSAGETIIANSKFYDNNVTPIIIESGSSYTEIIDTEITGNTGVNGASAIGLGVAGNIGIKHSTIANNTGTGAGYETGAIASKNFTGNITIDNTSFKNNKNQSVNSGIFGGGGGAMSLHYFRGNLSINQSYFKENQAGGSGNAPTYDGGAIYIIDGRDGASVSIDQTTFEGNIAKDDGGAIMFQGTGNPGLTTNITNSTFYGNKAYGVNGGHVSGGAIQYFKNGGSSKMDNSISGTTFVDNESGNEDTAGKQSGGAIGRSGAGWFATAAVNTNGSLYLGNKAYEDGVINQNSSGKDIFPNVSNTQGNNILRADQGTAADVAQAKRDVFGITNPHLSTDQSDIIAGMEDEIIPTLPIKPQGNADDTYTHTKALGNYDQRGKKRLKDIGAVELLWIQYDANGGLFDLVDMADYEGEAYYEKDASSEIHNYYDILSADSSKEEQTEDGLHPTRPGYKFAGWSTTQGATQPDFPLNGHTPIQVGEHNVTLYAVWRVADEFTVTYHGNGHTGGVVPTDNKLYDTNDSATILDAGTMIKDGFKFVGWNSAADGNGQDIAIDTIISMTANIDLYAKWEEIIIPVVEEYTVTYHGNGNTAGIVPTDTTQYLKNTDATVKSAESMIKDGFKFIGWNTAADGTGKNVLVDEKLTMIANVDLYAQWEKETKPVGPTKPDEPSKPVDPTKPEKPVKPTEPNKPGSNGNNSENLPQAGVSDSQSGLWLSLALMGLGFILIPKTKKD